MSAPDFTGYHLGMVTKAGRVVAVERLMFGEGQIVAARDAHRWKDGREEMWLYKTFAQCVEAFFGWDGVGEPDGWVRHVPSFRRREDGDPNKETVRP